MPLFEFSCEECGSQFETIVRGGRAASCPSCGGAELSKLLSVPARPKRNDGGFASFDGPPPPCAQCEHPGGPAACAMKN